MEKRTRIEDIVPGMIVAYTVKSKNGDTIVSKGTKLTTDLIRTIRSNRISEITVLQTIHDLSDKHANDKQPGVKATSEPSSSVKISKDDKAELDSVNYANHQFLLDEIMRNDITHRASFLYHKNFFQVERARKMREDVLKVIEDMLKDLHVLAMLVMMRTSQPQSIDQHTQITILSILIGKDLGMDEEQLLILAKGAMLFRIGSHSMRLQLRKIIEPSSFQQMVQGFQQKDLVEQSVQGSELLKRWFGFEVSRVARDQYERNDGTGFPDGKSANEISLITKIIGVASKYVLMQNPAEPDKKAASSEMAFDYILNSEGSWFDPNIVNSFRKFMHPYALGSVVEMRDGSYAIVIKHGSAPNFGPLIKIVAARTSQYKDNQFIDTNDFEEPIIKKIVSGSNL